MTQTFHVVIVADAPSAVPLGKGELPFRRDRLGEPSSRSGQRKCGNECRHFNEPNGCFGSPGMEATPAPSFGVALGQFHPDLG